MFGMAMISRPNMEHKTFKSSFALNDITFVLGKRLIQLIVLNQEYNRYGWWVGEMKGTIGLVPKAYIMEMYDI